MKTRSLPQDPEFVDLCLREPKEFFEQIHIPCDSFSQVEDTLILSAAAFCDNGIEHLLDGYSWSIFTRISYNQPSNGVVITVKCLKIPADENLRQTEKGTTKRKFGLFSGRLSTLKKIFLARLPDLLITGRAVERQTAHQPVFYPSLNQAYFCSSYTYPAFEARWDQGQPRQLDITGPIHRPFIPEHFPVNDYTCMHPLYDSNTQQLLTYSYIHSKFSRKTTVNFYAFGPGEKVRTVKKYVIPDRAALHMFGFTEKYYVIFANSLVLQPCGTLSMICGSPILRTLDDNFCGDLIIHFIPRDEFSGLKAFSVNTKRQGFVYHTINCFDVPGGVVVDAFVSKLNASRESSQFELGKQPVFDNEGDPFRFYISRETGVTKSKLLTVQLDSSIDFHCVNPLYLGKPYENWWMVTHRRERDAFDSITKVSSVLTRVRNTLDGSNPLNFNPETSAVASRLSDTWHKGTSVVREYLRTPLFVSHKYPKGEDDGILFCWSYSSPIEDSQLGAQILLIAPNLDLVKKIDVPGNNRIPYSVHSSVYTRDSEDVSPFR